MSHAVCIDWSVRCTNLKVKFINPRRACAARVIVLGLCTPRKTRMRMNLDHVASGHFVFGRDIHMKRVRAVKSDSVKSARKAKDRLHKACGRASKICERIGLHS